MANKQTGYDFWRNVLKSPKYVAAPMVDMSELAFRMLCRNHGSQLCYSPMFHSQQFSDDFLYRKDNFSTCDEDRPLIVQFCANDPDVFVKAASLVANQCDAVDLNLGCPQAIAKKGFYGAFLQDDWDLIYSIVHKASSELPMPVTCKMRILPGDSARSVEYARMLERAGCSILTVHGRTREQKGHATGLASWDVIREIKKGVNIPVIANGNILSFDDVVRCLSYTGADAVMSAEGLLHNPALFSGENPPVWEIVEEYLSLAEKYQTPIRFVRSHLFKILYLCSFQDKNINQILIDGSSLEDFASISASLKKLNNVQCTNNDDSTVKEQLVCDFSALNINVDDLSSTDFIDITTDKSNNSSETSVADCKKEKHSVATCNGSDTLTDYELPIYVCHSRPRITDDDKTRGCFRKYFDETPVSEDNNNLSKKRLRKARHHERVLASRKEKRKEKKLRRKEKKAEMIRNGDLPLLENEPKKSGLTKQQQKMLIRQRLSDAQGTAPKICINLGFSSTMSNKELTQLSSQLRRLYGSNRHSIAPLYLLFCSFSSSDPLYQICVAKNDGFASYVVEMTPNAPEDMFDVQNIIYLSPDSENVIDKLDRDKVYVIGGIVDGTVKKDLSLNHAKTQNIITARLPIREHLVQYSNNPGTMVLTVNQVFDILLKYYETEDWTESLSSHVPLRKGFCSPLQKDELQSNQKTCSNFCENSILS